jgi:pyruvate kinase
MESNEIKEPKINLPNLNLEPKMKIDDSQNTKILATVGPASSSPEMLLELVKAGVDVFRLNFSHGTHEDHMEVINRVTYINEKYGLHIGILADLQGPKLRVGEIENNALEIKEGDILTFVNEKCVGNMEKIYMSYENFAEDVEVGERVLVDDGKLVFEVLETNKKDVVKLKVLFGGTLSSRKGVNLPNTKISLPSLTEKDLRDLDFILTQPVNWIALSFVRSPEDLHNLRRMLEEVNHPAKIMAKIEKPEAIDRIDAIIKASNAVMVARGDLGIEVPMERLPMIQKNIIAKCIQRARPVVVATQMMDSMIQNPSPTRAEITDVANAVFDGADAVMLSGETSVGKHPVKVVQAMNRIIGEVEKTYDPPVRPVPPERSRTYLSDAICFTAARTAEEVGAKAIVGMTSSGYTAFKVSSFRPRKQQIFIFSDRMHMLATLNLVWGVRCFYYDRFTSTDETINDVNSILKAAGKVERDDVLINTGSMPIHKRHRTNMLRVTVVE